VAGAEHRGYVRLLGIASLVIAKPQQTLAFGCSFNWCDTVMKYFQIKQSLSIQDRYRLQPFRASIQTIVIVLILGGSATDLRAEPQAQSSTNSTSAKIMVLEGKSFAGELGLKGKPASNTDLVIFNDGRFISEGCQRRCGYTDGKYWVRKEGDQLQVKSETPCLKTDATILWEGVINGDEIEGTFTWVNKRWYWTFEKEFWFRGKLVETAKKEPSQQ
jgi:hypothetical protein